MRAPRPFISSYLLVLAAVSVSTFAFPAFAGGPGDGAASPKPKPAVEKRIYTNDDLDAMAAQYGGPARQNEPITVSTLERATEPSAKTARLAALPNERNPVWYAQRTVTLQAELASIDIDIARLRQFRASGTTTSPGVTVGLALYAPCEGITTDNRIDQLVQHRLEIAAQLNALDDAVLRNAFPPGMVRNSDEILQAAQSRVVVTPEQRRADLARNAQALSTELGQIQDTFGSMNEQAAAQDITLLPVTPGYGGNMTTNYIEDLANQASELRQKISEIQDEERTIGTPPAALR